MTSDLRAVERFGVTSPVRLRRLHQMKIVGDARHNNNEEGRYLPNSSADKHQQPTIESSPIMTINNSNAAIVQENQQETSTPPDGNVIEFTSVTADGQQLRNIGIDMRVTHTTPVRTKLQMAATSAKQVGTIGGGVLLGLGMYEGAKLLTKWLFGASSDAAPPPPVS